MKKRHRTNTLRDLFDCYPISEAEAFKIARVHRTTWQRWMTGISEPSPAILDLIRLRCLGEIQAGGFDGWRVVGMYLIDENGSEYTRDDIKRLPLYKSQSRQLLNLIQRQTPKIVNATSDYLEAVEATPLPLSE